jgi:hypothetical protein
MPRPVPLAHLERLAPILAGALLALPVLLAHYPPMADLPLHEAVIGLLRHWGDPRYVAPDIYQLNIGHANQLFYFLILPLAYVFPIGTATKLIVAGTVFLLPVAVGRFADHLGVTRWSAAVIAPIGLGWMFFWGLLANLMGLGFYFLALPSIDRFCQKPTVRDFFTILGWVTLLHFAHDVMALIAGGTIILFTVCDHRGWRASLTRLLPAGFVVAEAVVSRIIATRLTNAYHAKLHSFDWYPFGHKLLTIPGVLYAGYEEWVRDLIFVVCFVPTVLFAIERWNARTPKVRTLRDWLHDFRFEILSASLLFSYFVAPLNMRGTTLIYHRFLAPAWILLTVSACSRVRPERPMRVARLLAAFVPIAPLLTSWERFVDSSRTYTDLDAAIAHMEPGTTYIVEELGPTKSYDLYQPVTGGGHIVAVLGGRGFFDFTRSEASPVYQRLDKQWSESFERMDGHPYRFIPEFDLKRFRYVVLHTKDVNIANVAALALQPEAHFVFRQGDWTVVESNLPLEPVDSPDERPPVPHGASLHKRCKALLEKIKAMPLDEQEQDIPLEMQSGGAHSP